MSLFQSISGRRAGVIINHIFLLLTLLLGFAGHAIGWSTLTTIGFWVTVAIVLLTSYPLHVRSGFWRMTHKRAERMDERELYQTLEALRHAYILYSIITLFIILTATVLDISNQLLHLIVFWLLLYLAHTLPSSILAWRARRIPSQVEE